MLLYFALKHTEDGKINFDKVAKSMGLDTGNAAYTALVLSDNPLSHLLTEVGKSATPVCSKSKTKVSTVA